MHENIHRQCVVEEVVEDVEGLEGGARVGEVVGGEWTKGLRGRNLAMEAGVVAVGEGSEGERKLG